MFRRLFLALLVVATALVMQPLTSLAAPPASSTCNIGGVQQSCTWATQDWATGFTPLANRSAYGIAFDSNGTGYVANFLQKNIFRFSLDGGVASTPINSNPYPDRVGGLAMTADNRLFASFNLMKQIVEINPSTGAVVRVVATVPTYPLALAIDPNVDPATGGHDLFVSDDQSTIYKINNVTGPGTATVSVFSTVPAISGNGANVDGLYFNQQNGDGTLYAADSPYILKIYGTNSPNAGQIQQVIRGVDPTTGTEVDIPGADGIAVAISNASNPLGQTPFLVVNSNNGNMYMVDLTNSHVSTVFTGGTRGDLATVGPDGCVYATQTNEVVRVSGGALTCSFSPTYPLPPTPYIPHTLSTFVNVQPVVQDYHDTTTLTATVTDANHNPVSSGTLTFSVAGGNVPPACVNVTVSNGSASCSYSPTQTSSIPPVGTADPNPTGSPQYTVTATYNGGSYTGTSSYYTTYGISSSTSTVTVTREETTTTYTGGTSFVIGQPGTLSAKLVQDQGVSPDGPIAGRYLTLSLGTASCQAGPTDNNGNASCQVTVPAPASGNSEQIAASFAGDAYYRPSGAPASTALIQIKAATSVIASSPGEYDDTLTFSGTLTTTSNGSPVAGATLVFTAGSLTCNGQTNGSGVATCSVVPHGTGNVGAIPAVVSFNGDATHLSSSSTFTTAIDREETATKVLSNAPGSNQVGQYASSPVSLIQAGAPAHLVSQVFEGDGTDPRDGTPTSIPFTGSNGQVWPTGPVTLTLNLGTTPLSCQATVSQSGPNAGLAVCDTATSVPSTVPTGYYTITAQFGGDSYYKPSQGTAQALVYAFPATGNFVIGDKSADAWIHNTLTNSGDQTVYFWGSQWQKMQQWYHYAYPTPESDANSFKGFVDQTGPLACMHNYTSDPGNSSRPPATLPTYMAVLVSHYVYKQPGSTVTGDIPMIIIVKTNTGYSADDGSNSGSDKKSSSGDPSASTSSDSGKSSGSGSDPSSNSGQGTSSSSQPGSSPSDDGGKSGSGSSNGSGNGSASGSGSSGGNNSGTGGGNSGYSNNPGHPGTGTYAATLCGSTSNPSTLPGPPPTDDHGNSGSGSGSSGSSGGNSGSGQGTCSTSTSGTTSSSSDDHSKSGTSSGSGSPSSSDDKSKSGGTPGSCSGQGTCSTSTSGTTSSSSDDHSKSGTSSGSGSPSSSDDKSKSGGTPGSCSGSGSGTTPSSSDDGGNKSGSSSSHP